MKGYDNKMNRKDAWYKYVILKYDKGLGLTQCMGNLFFNLMS